MKQILPLLLLWLCLGYAHAQQVQPVHFVWGTEIFPPNFSAIRQTPAIAAAEIVNGRYVRYIQCKQIPTAAERAVLENAGVQFMAYIQFGAYLVSIPQAFDLGQFEKLQVLSIIPVKNDWKIAQNLKEQPYGAWAVHGDQIDVNIQLYPQVDLKTGAELCRKNGLTVLLEGNQNGFLQVRMLQENLDAVAALPYIRHLELVPPPGKPEDTKGRSLHRSNLVDSDHALGNHYNGDGVTVLVRDDGILGPHIDFTGRLTNLSGVNTGNHGDGVGGIIGGAGNIDPAKKGMAAGTKIFAIDYTAQFQDQTLPLHLNENVTITNSSYSDGCNDGYTLATQTVDRQLFEYPTLMHVFSAGNSNPSDCDYGAGASWGNITGGHKQAKNAIATANLQADATLTVSSSRGPAHDGRLKPDISANGTAQNSTDTDNSYQVFGGTSAAAPGIAGCLAQLTQAFKSQHNGQQPEAALLKAAILNTANDLGNIGPDYKFGWGHVNAYRALRLLQQSRHLAGAIEQSGKTNYTLQIPANTKQVRIMLYWADAPADPGASRALLNDLDLTVTGPNNLVNYPWKLDPTPDPFILDTPAGYGRDSLNNVEQVAIDNPGTGSYTITVKGFEVPFGPQPYYIVWEFRTEEIKITYPNGGEGFVPGETERIHWDAQGDNGNFTLEYSINDGVNWQSLTQLDGAKRMYDWTVPNTISGKVRLQLTRADQRDTSDYAFTIAPLPQSIGFKQICPDSMTLAWVKTIDTLRTDVYLLGNKYMELKGTSDTTFYTFPFANDGNPAWVSVRSSHANGLAGRRALAVQWTGGLLYCPQQYDAGVQALLLPAGGAIVACDASTQQVKVRVVNEALNPINAATLSYRVNNAVPVTEPLPQIPVGDTLDYLFTVPIALLTNGVINLKIWVNYLQDLVRYNDTLALRFPVIVNAVSGTFIEPFNSGLSLPLGWTVINLDNAITWRMSDVAVINADGNEASVPFIPCYNYEERGQEDVLQMIPVDLTGIEDPGLTFSLAHAGYSGDYSDALRVEVFSDCDLGAAPIVVWQKNDPELATITLSTAYYVPGDAADWKLEQVDLQQFANKKIVVRFVSTNDYGNNIYLDNIGIAQINTTPADAVFFPSVDSLCRLDTVYYTLANPQVATTFAWSFGAQAQPSTATGLGPHAVRYITAGAKSVRLIASNNISADTVTRVVQVLPFPIPNFTAVLNAQTITLTNTSQNASAYVWNFGDGEVSTETSPTHTYANPGTFTVKLTASSKCSAVKSTTYTLTVGITEIAGQIGVQILPNPTAGDFVVSMHSRTTAQSVVLRLFDTQGRLVKTIESTARQGSNKVAFENLNLPKGIYQLQIQTESGGETFPVIVQ